MMVIVMIVRQAALFVALAGFEAATPGSAAGAKTSLKGHLKLLHCRKQGNKAKV